MQKIRAKLDYILKHNFVLNKIFKICIGMAIRFIGIFVRIDEKAILFVAHGRKYNDSPRKIYENLINDSKYADYKFFWAVEDGVKVDNIERCVVVKPDTFRYFKIALRCKYWITCVNVERSLRFKKKKCVYLNTWHGIPIKTVGNEAKGRKDYDFSYINYFCISGEYERDIYKRSFKLKDDQIIKTGMPRNDDLYDVSSEDVLNIKKKLGLPIDKKILLYAPTWRDSVDGGKTYEIKPPVNMDYWEKELVNEYVVLVRTHPYTTKLLGIKDNFFVKDCSDYPNVNDLLKISDILISDYSAVIFDYSILDRPILCFAYDLDDYAKERGLVMDLKQEMPSGVFTTEKELLRKIQSMDYLEECKNTALFKKKYIEYGGNATKQCVDYLLEREGK